MELAVVNQPGKPGVLVDSGGSSPNDASLLVGCAAFCYVEERKTSKVREFVSCFLVNAPERYVTGCTSMNTAVGKIFHF